jgi:hypothetical protein
VTGLQQIMLSDPTPADFLAVELGYKDGACAKTLEGVVNYLLDTQHDFAGSTEKDRLHVWAAWAHPGDFAFTGVRGFALAGSNIFKFSWERIRPSRTARFASLSINASIARLLLPEALFLLERAAKRTNFRLRDIDSAIWNQAVRGIKV